MKRGSVMTRNSEMIRCSALTRGSAMTRGSVVPREIKWLKLLLSKLSGNNFVQMCAWVALVVKTKIVSLPKI